MNEHEVILKAVCTASLILIIPAMTFFFIGVYKDYKNTTNKK